MAIRTATLRNLARQPAYGSERYGSLYEAKAAAAKTAFLCHSHHDGEIVRGLIAYFKKIGWNVYVDWMDVTMPEAPNRETAEKIQTKINQTDYFLFLATKNSMTSRWCPWEVGYADGVQKRDKILIIPTEEGGIYYGNEYLQLYRRIDEAMDGGLGVWNVNETTGIYLNSL